jgi:hypothetical protein
MTLPFTVYVSLCKLIHWGKKMDIISRALLVHTCNSHYLGSRDQKNRSSKPTWANSSQDPKSKIPHILKKKKKGRQRGSSGRVPI